MMPSKSAALVGGLLRLWVFAALAIATALPFAGPSSARDITSVEKTALTARVESFNAAMRDHKVDTVIDVIPPRVIDTIAKNNGVDAMALRRSMAEQTSKLLETGAIKAFGMKVADAKMQALPDGTPYALLPTSVTVEMNGRKIESQMDTLAMMDGGKWYLLDLSKTPQVALFTQVYPEFSNVQFGGKSTKVVP